MNVHKMCQTEIESKFERYGEKDDIFGSTYCYSWCPKCCMQVTYKEIEFMKGDTDGFDDYEE